MTEYDFGLRGKRALITGAASGIGQSTARVFAEFGCRIAVADIRADRLDQLMPTLAGSERHVALPLDLADGPACESSIQVAAARMGGLDIVINAAAILHRQPLTEVSADSLYAMTAVNMWGSFFIARAAAQHMAQSNGGSIILLSSQAAYTGGYESSTVYAMTKAAVAVLIKSLAREYGARGVRVNGIAPGVIETPMIREGVTPQALERLRKMIPMGRIGLPEEVALCCSFLAGPAAQYITGQMLHINGGQLML